MSHLFNDFIYQPIYNLLIVFYNVIPGHDLGVAIVALTLVVRFVLYPIAKKQIESQKKLQELQPEIKKIQEKYKNDREKQGKVMMEFYREKKVNPASGCLPLVIQIVFFIALYRAFIAGINFSSGCNNLYSFVQCPALVQLKSLGFLDLSKPNVILAAIAAALQYVQAKMMMIKQAAPVSKGDFSTAMNQQMVYLGPVLTLLIGIRFPAGLAVYWIVNTLFSVVQQYLIIYKKKPLLEKSA
jgi:YidC/Oxa1 family membrane protein insertase